MIIALLCNLDKFAAGDAADRTTFRGAAASKNGMLALFAASIKNKFMKRCIYDLLKLFYCFIVIDVFFVF